MNEIVPITQQAIIFHQINQSITQLYSPRRYQNIKPSIAIKNQTEENNNKKPALISRIINLITFQIQRILYNIRVISYKIP